MVEHLEFYRTFYYAAKYESFSKAADALCLTQSAVSQSIHRLERHVGTLLFQRVAHNMMLTPEGAALFQHVSLAMSTLEAGEDQLARLATLDEGTLTIGATETGLVHYILPRLSRFKRAHPKVNLTVQGTQGKELIDLLVAGNVDLIIGVTPIPQIQNANIVPLRTFHDQFFGGPSFEALRNETLDPGQLLQYPLATAGGESSVVNNLSDWLSSLGLSLTPQFQVMTTSFVLPFVEEGLAIGCAPEMFVQRWCTSRKLFPITLTQTPPPRQIFLATSKSMPLSMAARAFIDSLGQP